MNPQGKGKIERTCDTCVRECNLRTGYDHDPFEPHFHRIGPKTFECVSWSDNPKEENIETQDTMKMQTYKQREYPR